MELLFATPGFGSNPNNSFLPLVATELQRRGHEVRGVQFQPAEDVDYLTVERIEVPTLTTPWWLGQRITYRYWTRHLRQRLAEDSPDAIVADQTALVPTVRAGRTTDVPVVGVVPGLGFTQFNPLKLGHDKTPAFRDLPWSAKLQYPAVRALFREHRRTLPEAAALVTVSDFLRQTLAETFGAKSTVIRTPVHLQMVRSSTSTPEFLTFVNPRNELKGADVLLKLAEALPNERFQVAGTFASDEIAGRAETLPNVKTLGWVDDIKEVYSSAELLLLPSRYEEGGPRVIVEAFANGVPVVGTDRGGTAEFIGAAGHVINNPDDINEWRRKIAAARESRSELSSLARERAKLFDAENQVDMFEALLETVVDSH